MLFNKGLEIRVGKANFSTNTLDVCLLERRGLGEDGEHIVAGCSNVEMTTLKPGEMPRTVLHLHIDKAKILMDELWNAGIRPSNSVGSQGHLKALEYHLEDMRKLVFDKDIHMTILNDKGGK